MSEFESPDRQQPGRKVTVEDVLELSGATTPHFALHVRNRLRNLVAGLPKDDPAYVLAQAEIAKLEGLAVGGERRGTARHPGESRLA
jgi:acyl-[acyl carrier protein]--UDP-N-acetylglucosamine O-acyltransferase